QQVTSLAPYSGTVYIAWHVPSGGLDGWRLYIDDVTVEVAPTCLPPSALAANGVTATGANLSWTASTSNPANGYEWEVRSSGAGGSGATGLVDNGTSAGLTATTAALTANTTYTLYVRGDCSNGDFSTWASVSFTTPCAAAAAPFLETFDAATATPNCWTNTATGTTQWLFSASGGSGPGYGVANSVDHTTGTGNFAWFDGSYSTSIPTLTVVPVDISTLTTPMVSIWVKANNTNDAALNTLKVQANNGTGWVDLI